MMIPPIVGVPALEWWPAGPSSRMFWPNSRTRRNSMKRGDRKTQISSAAVPAIRTSPIASERLGHGLEAHAARALDQHGVARADEAAHDVDGLLGGGGLVVAGHLGREGADGDEHVGVLAGV